MTSTSRPDQQPVRLGRAAVINVGVLGARGRMGTEVVKAVNAADDLELVAMVDDGRLAVRPRQRRRRRSSSTSPARTWSWRTSASASTRTSTAWSGRRASTRRKLATIAEWLEPKPDVGVVIAPNFGIGAVLLMQFAQEAARFFPSVEIVELHHPNKVDAPVGHRRAHRPAGRRRPRARPACPRPRTPRPTPCPAPAAPTSRACRCTRSG